MRPLYSTTLGLIGLVASVALLIAFSARIELADGSPVMGLGITVTCVAVTAALAALESIQARRGHGQPVTGSWLRPAIAKSCAIAVLIVGSSDVAFLLTYSLTVGGPRSFLSSVRLGAPGIVREGLFAGTLAAVSVCYLSRWAFCGSRLVRRPHLRVLAPAAVIVLLVGANMMLERSNRRYRVAQWHDYMAGINGGTSTIPYLTPPGYIPRPALAAYHARMRLKWEHASMRPWMAVDRDPPPPP
jgi:hypothetical protein